MRVLPFDDTVVTFVTLVVLNDVTVEVDDAVLRNKSSSSLLLKYAIPRSAWSHLPLVHGLSSGVPLQQPMNGGSV